MLPGGGYDSGLLCPPNADDMAHHREFLLERGAVQTGSCWDLSAVLSFVINTGSEYIFNFGTLSAAATFELASAQDFDWLSCASEFNQRVALTGLGNVVSTSGMLYYSISFNQPVSLEGIGSTGKWTQADAMFADAMLFNQPIDAIGDTSVVMDFFAMFAGAGQFNQPVTVLNTTSGTNIEKMFSSTPFFNQPVDHFVTTNVVDMEDMFEGASSFAQNLEAWDVRAVKDFSDMFLGSRMQYEVVAGGIGVGRACRLHHSWKAQNADWNPVIAGLVDNLAELDLSRCEPHLAGELAAPSPPPYPPMPAGGYGIKLLCPPNTLHLGLAHTQMVARGAIWVGSC